MEKLINWRKTLTPPTLENAGAMLGISAVQVLRLERGDRKVSLVKLPVVASVTGIPARELRPDLFEAMEAANEAAQ